MNTTLKRAYIIAGASVLVTTLLSSAQNNKSESANPPAAKTDLPAWVRRGIPGEGHAALKPLIATWRVHKSIYGTVGRSPDLPPVVSTDITTNRQWVADGHYVEDLTDGTLNGQPYWRKGWLGYSIMDRRYEWVTIDPLHTTMMIYYAQTASGATLPIDMTPVFNHPGVASQARVGTP